MVSTIQTSKLASRLAEWSDGVILNQIDPTSGITSLDLALGAGLVSDVSVESFELSASQWTITDSASVSLLRPDYSAQILNVTPSTTATATLGAWDGTTDFSGVSGRILRGTVGAAAGVTYTGSGIASPNAALLVGKGTVRLPVVARASVHATAPGNFTAQISSSVAATVTEVAATGSASSDPTLGSIFDSPPGASSAGTMLPAGLTTTAAQTRTIADKTTGWSTNLTFDGFDPALGTLYAVEILVTTDSTGSVAAESLDPWGSYLRVAQAATVSVLSATGAAIASNTAYRLWGTALSGYDGVTDNAGTSGSAGPSSADVHPGPNLVAIDTMAADLAQFTGKHAVAVPVVSQGATTIDGSGNLSISAALQAGATVTVTYAYQPGGTPAKQVVDPGLVAAGQTLTVVRPGPALTVASGGAVIVTAGGAATPITVAPGGREVIRSGATAPSVMVQAAGVAAGMLQVDSGAAVLGGTIGSGAVATVDGSLSNTLVDGAMLVLETGGSSAYNHIANGGTELVAGGSSVSATIDAGATQIVQADGSSLNVNLYGSAVVEAYGQAYGARLQDGSVLTVEAGGTATAPAFASGATLVVRGGAWVTDIPASAPATQSICATCHSRPRPSRRPTATGR